MRGTIRGVLVAATAAVAWAGWDRLTHDPAAWQADLQVLEDSLARGYANFDHQVARGMVDPVALHQRTDSLLRTSRTRSAARGALRNFAAAFEDGHLSVRRPVPGPIRWLEDRMAGRSDAPPGLSVGGEEACRALGYDNGDSPSLIALNEGWRSVSEIPGAGGGIIPADDRVVGVLRIASFGVDRHLSACQRAWPSAVRITDSTHCGGTCQDALRTATMDTILADHRRTLLALKAAGATMLVVDLTGNGGGNEYVSAAARQVTPRPLHGHLAGVIRHPHHVAQLTESATALQALRSSVVDSAFAVEIDSGLAMIARQSADLIASCDRRAIWRTAGPPPCPVLATHARTSGWRPYLPPTARSLAGASLLFTPLAHVYEEGVWDGPVIVLVDRRTASASEDFVVLLADHGAATIVGERTYGAGCGMTNGGIGFRLPHSGLVVRMPDCARIRMNGENEVAGVAPDVEAGWEDSDPEVERARKAVAAIAGVVSR